MIMVHSIVAAILLYLAPTEFPGLQWQLQYVQILQAYKVLRLAYASLLQSSVYMHIIMCIVLSMYCLHDTEKNSQ